MSTRILCPHCIEKQEQIYRLREEVKQLKAQLRIQQRKITEDYFGSATLSSKKPVKHNCDKTAKQKNRGSSRLGHPGMGRCSIPAAQADRVAAVRVNGGCPQCHAVDLESLDHRERTVIDYELNKVTRVYQIERKRCKACGTVVQAKAPGVLTKNL